MSETVVRIVVDSSNARSESLSAERALDRFGSASSRLDRNLGSLDLRITSVTRGMRGLRGALGTLGLGVVIGDFTGLADAASQMEAKLRLATEGNYSYAQANRDVHDISKRTRAELTSTATLYSKMTTNGKALKATQEQIARATETVNKSLAISGATTGEKQSTVLQLGQSLSSGKLNGDEFRSLSENAPRLMQLLADAIGKPRGELKKLASEGKLTSEVLFRALSDPQFTAKLDEEFKRIPPTFGDAMTAVKNAAVDAFGAFDKGGRFSQSIYNFVTDATGNMGQITTAMQTAGQAISTTFGVISDNASTLAMIIGGVVAARFGVFVQAVGVRAVAALTSFRAASLAAASGVTALGALGPVAGTASKALGALSVAGNGLLAMFGGPLGIAVTGVAVALGYFAANAANTANILANSNGILAETDKLIKDMSVSADDAAGTVAGVGSDANAAVPGINAFAGAVGNAAQKLYELANARRESNIAALEGQRTKLSKEYSDLYVVSKKGRRAAMTDPNEPASFGDFTRRVGNFISGEVGEALGYGTPDSEIDQGMADRKAKMAQIDRETKRLRRAQAEAFVRPEDRISNNGPIQLGAGSGTGKKGRGGKSDAEREAEQAAREAERMAEATADLWKNLEDNRKLASLMPIEAERYNAQLDLQKASGKTLVQLEAERAAAGKDSLETILAQTRANKLITDMKVANENGRNELEYQKRRLNMTDKQSAISEAAWEFEKRALEEKVDLTNAEYQTQLALVKARAGETYEIRKQNDLIKSREALLTQYGPANAAELDMKQFEADKKQLFNLVMSGEITTEQYERSLDGLNRAATEVANRFEIEFAQRIATLGDQLGGTFGKAVGKFGELIYGLVEGAKGNFSSLGPIGSIIDLLGKNKDGTLNPLGDAAAKSSQKTLDSLLGRNGQKSALLNPLKSLGEGFGGFKGDMKKIFTGKGPGSVAGAIGNTLGKAAGGAQMGQMADGLMKSLGIASSKTGAQIGGALGNMFGPIGGLIGSFGGGLIGGLFKKKKYGTASISMGEDGNLDSSVQGNKSAFKQAATGAASSVISGLDQIAEALGGALSGNPNISIGQYKDKWRVSTTGRTGKLKGKYGDVTDFGKDGQEAAIEFATKAALQQGVLSGISDFSQRVLRAAEDLDRAVNLAAKYENIMKELARIDDPVGAPLKELNAEFEKLRKEMIANKATAGELANVDRYYMLQRDKMLKDSLSDLTSFRDKLMGEGSGLSSKSRLDSKLNEFAKFEADIAAGKSIDTSKLTELGESIWSLTKDTYGTATGQSQNIRNRLLSAVDNASAQISDMYAGTPANVVQAVDTTNQLMAENIKTGAQTNSKLDEIAELLRAGNAVKSSGGTTSAKNGKQYGTV